MTHEATTTAPAVAISISESPDIGALGLSPEHLRDAMAEIALTLLAAGTSLAYGGDLRSHGFTELLFELLTRYRGHPRHRRKIAVTNYLAWPVHIRMTADELSSFSAEHENSTRLIFLARDGSRIGRKRCNRLKAREPDEAEWTEGLTAMRTVMREETEARVVLGGRVEGYKGRWPGIAEEVLLSLRSRQPVFLIGGFGGCTRDVAETIGLVEPWAGSRSTWAGRSLFEEYTPEDLHNGLSREDNCILGKTPYIQQAVTLVSRGLSRLRSKSHCARPEGDIDA